MASNIRVQRICQHCGTDFTARTTTTMYCSKRCNSQSYKDKLKSEKIEASNQQTRKTKNHQIEQLNAKEYLTVREVAQLLNCPQVVKSFDYGIVTSSRQVDNMVFV